MARNRKKRRRFSKKYRKAGTSSKHIKRALARRGGFRL